MGSTWGYRTDLVVQCCGCDSSQWPLACVDIQHSRIAFLPEPVVVFLCGAFPPPVLVEGVDPQELGRLDSIQVRV